MNAMLHGMVKPQMIIADDIQMKHIMLDLETISSQYNAGIISIGACSFELNGSGVDKTFEVAIDPQSSIKAGLHQSKETMEWWDKQSIEAKQRAFPENAKILLHGLIDFAEFVESIGNKKEIAIWGNGATFDNVIIRNAYHAVWIDDNAIPWGFRGDKCYRTVINLLPEFAQPKFVRIGLSHNALDDAISQAMHLQKCWKLMHLD